MKSIRVNDIEADKIDMLCELLDTTEEDLIEAMFRALEEHEIQIQEYLWG